MRSVGSVAFLEKPATDQWNSQGRKIAGAGGPVVGVARAFARCKRIELFDEFLHRCRRPAAALLEERPVRAVTAHRQRARASDVRHTRQRREALEHTMMKLRELSHLSGVLRLRQQNRHRDNAFRAESGIDRHEPLKAAAKQAGADKQHQRQRHLGDDKNIACARL